jgi:hypothetical protein
MIGWRPIPMCHKGKWYKRFKRFTLAGESELPKTFLEPGMALHGREVV